MFEPIVKYVTLGSVSSRVALLALEQTVEEPVRHLGVVEPRVAHAALAHHRVLCRARIRAVADGRDHRPLLIRHLGLGGLAHVVEEREVGTDRDVVPRHEPQPGNVERHVVVIEPALVPRRIVRRALDHAAAGVHRHRVGKDASRAVDGLEDVLHRQVPERLGPVHRRQLLRQVERLRGADQILLRRVARKHRPHLVLLAVDPGDEQHLHGPAPIPVALLEVRRHAPHAGAESLHVHRRVRRMAERGDAHLVLSRRRTPGRPDLAVRPRLLRQPRERVVAVLRRAEDVVVAFGEEMAALVLHDVRVAPLDRRQRRRHVARHAVPHVPVVEVVGRAHPDGWNLRRRRPSDDRCRWPAARRPASASSPCARRRQSTEAPSRSPSAAPPRRAPSPRRAGPDRWRWRRQSQRQWHR